LLDAYQYIVTQMAIAKAKKGQNFPADDDGFVRTSVSGLLTEKNKNILEQNLYGYDFDSTMVRLALMNLMMHGIDNPHVDYQDTLSKSFTVDKEYDIVMANPPFTGSIDKGDINETLKLNTTKTELLFTERIFNLLKTGGTAGIIVPQGVLFGAGGAFVEARRKLVEEAIRLCRRRGNHRRRRPWRVRLCIPGKGHRKVARCAGRERWRGKRRWSCPEEPRSGP
jgi:type I restriction enzyme M protein